MEGTWVQKIINQHAYFITYVVELALEIIDFPFQVADKSPRTAFEEHGMYGRKEALFSMAFPDLVPLDTGILHHVAKMCSSVLDLGAHVGHASKWLADYGVLVHAVDGTRGIFNITHGRVEEVDLVTEKISAQRWGLSEFDCVLSIEVAEHIPPEFEDMFLGHLELAKMAFLSWAVIGQGGTGHVNCQSTDAVKEKMEARGWILDQNVTTALRRDSSWDYIANSVALWRKNERTK
eukprot:GEMP01039310.1.p1 GENE.GEMP01039310.1~~GEMP01039310.1.p1  ORF type:complete len:235 (+),score=53.42 GEMP01039310.1:594-1298(+)